MSEPRIPPWVGRWSAAEDLPDHYVGAVIQWIGPLVGRIEALARAIGRPVVVGINGAQGSGKSTLAGFLQQWLIRENGLSCAVFALDDLYLDKADRDVLGKRQHPLLVTRGVPGTHDVVLGRRLLQSLTAAQDRHTVAIPLFDKARDERLPPERWQRVEAPVEVVLFEGWCVGARSQAPSELAKPVNRLEAEEDRDGSWRRWVNERLATDYAEWFRALDGLIMLRVPSFRKVYEWRALQELKLDRALRGNGPAKRSGRAQGPSQLRRFIMHFERLTRHMLNTLPAAADTVIDIDDRHRMARMKLQGWDGRLAARLRAASPRD